MPYKLTIPPNLPSMTDRELRQWYERNSRANQESAEHEFGERLRELTASVQRGADRTEKRLQDALLAEVSRRELARKTTATPRAEALEANRAVERLREEIYRRRERGLAVDDQVWRLAALQDEREQLLRRVRRGEARAV